VKDLLAALVAIGEIDDITANNAYSIAGTWSPATSPLGLLDHARHAIAISKGEPYMKGQVNELVERFTYIRYEVLLTAPTLGMAHERLMKLADRSVVVKRAAAITRTVGRARLEFESGTGVSIASQRSIRDRIRDVVPQWLLVGEHDEPLDDDTRDLLAQRRVEIVTVLGLRKEQDA